VPPAAQHFSCHQFFSVKMSKYKMQTASAWRLA
jgi:hypothetical protein